MLCILCLLVEMVLVAAARFHYTVDMLVPGPSDPSFVILWTFLIWPFFWFPCLALAVFFASVWREVYSKL